MICIYDALIYMIKLMGEYMYTYDIKNKIIAEQRKKLLGDAVISSVLLAIAILVILSGNLTRPFHVVKPETDEELSKAYSEKVDYISLKSLELEFTGYYKTNRAGRVVYNCYATSFNELKYIVFVPAKKSGIDPKNPDRILKDYSFIAKLQKDEELFDMIHKDYEIELEEIDDYFGLSSIVFNEAKSNRNDMLALWFLFVIIVVIGITYITDSFINVFNFKRIKAVSLLSQYGNIETVLSEINLEMMNDKIFDSIYISVTKNWFISFRDGEIIIVKVSDIKTIQEESSLKKAYGLVPIGKALFIKLQMKGGESYQILTESLLDMKEIIEAVKFSSDSVNLDLNTDSVNLDFNNDNKRKI